MSMAWLIPIRLRPRHVQPFSFRSPDLQNIIFTMDLRPVNRFTVKHEYPMPNIEQELVRISGSRFFLHGSLPLLLAAGARS